MLINAESLSEIKEINRIAKSKNKRIKIGVRLNPNTDAKTLSQISTGKKENKFGVNEKTFFDLVNYCKNSKNIELKCLSVHIGSQILDHQPYKKMLSVINKILNSMYNRGPDNQDKIRFEVGKKNLYLFHSRLSIIDLEPRSHQPFKFRNYTLVFNGEIYNFLDVRGCV